eukprot:11332927-Heterocapsa_arctica.AAC.1
MQHCAPPALMKRSKPSDLPARPEKAYKIEMLAAASSVVAVSRDPAGVADATASRVASDEAMSAP